jgi:hypothetical protein
MSILGSGKNHRCSRCGSSILRRSRTRFWERPFRLIFLRPYRCRDCEHRCYASIWLDLAYHESRTSPERESSSAVSDASGKGLWTRRRTWILASGLATCLVIGGIASLKFGNKLPRWLSVDEIRSSLFPRPNQNPTRNPKQSVLSKPPDVPATAGTSIANSEPSHPTARRDDVNDSSEPKAIRAVRPKLPAKVQSKVTSDNIVKVRVRIDRSGRVVGATAVSTEGPMARSLAGYALASARRWRFQPARNNGKPVGSQSVLEFLFRPSDT